MAALLATVGVGISVGLMTLFGYYVLGLPFWIAMLLGAVTSPTDAAAIFSVLRTVPIPHSLRGALEAESGLNDAPTVLLVMLASSFAVVGRLSGIPGLIGLIVLELLGGMAIGGALGWLGAQILRRVALPSSGLYPLSILVWTIFAYGITALVHASGFAAVYVCALILGNAQLRTVPRPLLRRRNWLDRPDRPVRHAGTAGLPRSGDASRCSDCSPGGPFPDARRPPCLNRGLCVVVQDSGAPPGVPLWAGLRGAVPIVLATIPLAQEVAGAEFLFDVVLVFVIVFTCLQGPTLPLFARLLGLDDDETRMMSRWRLRHSTGSLLICCRFGSRPSRGSPVSKWPSFGFPGTPWCP